MMKASDAQRPCSSIIGAIVSNFVMQALRGEDITVYGEGNQTRSFCYVDDLVDGLIRLMETADDMTGPVNLGNPIEFTMRQLAEMIIELTGSSSKIAYRPANGKNGTFIAALVE